MKSGIKWGFIGCGNVVMNKSGVAFKQHPNSRVVSVMSRNIENARKAAEYLDAQHYYDSEDELLSSGVNAIYIATPPGMHLKQAKMCHKAGLPVYVEKPMGRSYCEAKEMVQLFLDSNIPLYVAHCRRALPRFIKIKDIIDSDAIGAVCSVFSTLYRAFRKEDLMHSWLYDVSMSGGGKFYDIAPHTVDLINYLFGEITEISGYAINSGTECPLEDNVVFSYKTTRGIIGTAIFNCIADRKEDRTVVYGTKGEIEFSIHDRDDVMVYDYKKKLRYNLGIEDPKVIEEPFVNKMISELQCDLYSTNDIKQALNTYKVIDLVLDSFYKSRKGNFWETYKGAYR